MDKKWIICIVILVILGLALGIGLAIYTNNRNETDRMDVLSEKELADNNEANMSVNIDENNVNVIETSAQEEKISPNAILIKKTYYKACDHLIRENVDIPKELVNKSEEDVKAMFPEWEIEKYTPTQITLYKSSNENCGEHYFVQEHNGVIGIYTTDQYGVRKLKKDTEISTQYLPEEDLQNLRAGVEIIGHTKLVEFLEDYE